MPWGFDPPLQILSLDDLARALAVRDYLSKATKIGRDRMRVVGYGETRPVAPNDTPEMRAENRRIEFRVQGAGN